MKRYLVEFIGTFFLVLTIGLTVRQGTPLAPVGIAAVLMAMIFAGGHISGAHYNPAVTLAAMVRGKHEAGHLIPYLVAQIAAAVLAAFLVNFLFGGPQSTPPPLRGTVPSIIAEFLFTFALAWVILNVATAKGTSGNSYYGFAIAATVLGGALAVGWISGASFNPAVSLGVYTMGLESAKQLGIYFASQIAAGLAAGYAFRATTGLD